MAKKVHDWDLVSPEVEARIEAETQASLCSRGLHSFSRRQAKVIAKHGATAATVRFTVKCIWCATCWEIDLYGHLCKVGRLSSTGEVAWE